MFISNTEADGRVGPTAVWATHQNRSPTSTIDNSITMNQIEAAIAAIESLEPGEQSSYRKIAIQYGCSRTSLAPRHQGRSGSREAMALNQQSFHTQQEQELLDYIDRLTGQGFPPKRAIVRSLASQIAQKELGVH
jgi:hypothetical protein